MAIVDVPYPKYAEPLYEAFICPLTKQVMQDPVSLENGQTFERSAITRWLQECKEKGRIPTCPVTGDELDSTSLRPSNALRSTIEEWIYRTDAAHIDNAKIVLMSGSFSEDILRALHDLRQLCSKNKVNQRRIRSAGIIPVLADQLRDGEEVRCSALSTLRIIAHDDDDNKVL